MFERKATGMELLMRGLVATLLVGIPFVFMLGVVWLVVHVIL